MNGKKTSSSFLSVIIILILLVTMLSMCNSSDSDSSSASGKTYTCGFCGKQMKGGYYDYFDGKYVCRSCSKKYRES